MRDGSGARPAATPSRRLPLSGAANFRDLGGYRTGDGRWTRWGRLFRSDILHELTDADVAVLADIGLVSVIDLRLSAERERSGSGPPPALGVTVHHHSVLPDEPPDPAVPGAVAAEPGETPAAPAPEGDDLAERYRWYLQVGRGPLLAALDRMAEPGAYPLVFHCTAGKDRTGVLAALVLDILGVPTETVVADYVLTQEGMPRILERLRADPHHGRRMDRVPAYRFAVDGAAMTRFMERLAAEHGGAAGWAVDAGMAPGRLARLPELLLEPG